MTETERYKRALEELKIMGHHWSFCSDARGTASALIDNALNLEEPLKVMRKGKWVDATSCAPIQLKDAKD